MKLNRITRSLISGKSPGRSATGVRTDDREVSIGSEKSCFATKPAKTESSKRADEAETSRGKRFRKVKELSKEFRSEFETASELSMVSANGEPQSKEARYSES
jgi:hypothetical protein